MDEIDLIAERSSAVVREEAKSVAGTEAALTDVRTASPAQSPSAGNPRRWLTIGVIAAAVVALVAGGIVLINRDEHRAIVPTAPDVDDTQPQPTATAPAVTAPSQTIVPPSTTVAPEPTTTTTSTGAPALHLGPTFDHGLSSSISADFRSILRQDYISVTATDRADYRLTIVLPSNATIRVNLGHDADQYQYQYENPQPATIGGDEGWVATGTPTSDVAYAVGRRLDDTTWLRVEGVRTQNGEPLPVVASSADTQALAEAFEYDATLDDRVQILTGDTTFNQFTPCTNDISVNGGGPDMVLFLCDGRFGVFSGATGEMLELIQQFDDQRAAAPEEGSGSAYVDGIAVSPDGQTIYFSVGPEPAVGTLYRYVRGSGIAPEMVSYGRSPSVSPDGQSVAVLAVDDILIVPTDGSSVSRSLTNLAVNPSGGSPSWSLDGSEIAFEVGHGVVAVADVATGETHLYASDEPGRWFTQPVYDPADGSLRAFSHCCDDATGPTDLVELGAPGNHSATVVGPVSQSFDGRIGPAAAPWATGVITWTAIPT